MGEFSKELLNMLTEFTVCEIGSRALDGITYTMVLNNEKDMVVYNRYTRIKKEALRCGFASDEIFRVYELQNGYIFDMDILTVKQITAEIVRSLTMNDLKHPVDPNMLRDLPEQRRKKDMISLGRYLKSEYDKGNREVEVALFNRNSINKITINGKMKNGDNVVIKYNAYAIRHWDIEVINERLLIPANFRVSRFQACEILPSKTGVSFILTLESMDGLY